MFELGGGEGEEETAEGLAEGLEGWLVVVRLVCKAEEKLAERKEAARRKRALATSVKSQLVEKKRRSGESPFNLFASLARACTETSGYPV